MGGGGSKTAPEGENAEDELPKETENDKKDPHNKPLDVGKDFGAPVKKGNAPTSSVHFYSRSRGSA